MKTHVGTKKKPRGSRRKKECQRDGKLKRGGVPGVLSKGAKKKKGAEKGGTPGKLEKRKKRVKKRKRTATGGKN